MLSDFELSTASFCGPPPTKLEKRAFLERSGSKLFFSKNQLFFRRSGRLYRVSGNNLFLMIKKFQKGHKKDFFERFFRKSFRFSFLTGQKPCFENKNQVLAGKKTWKPYSEKKILIKNLFLMEIFFS